MIDRLEEIFAKQSELLERVAPVERGNGVAVPSPDHYGKLDYRYVQHFLKDLAWCTTEELGEAMNELKNRPWKTSFTQTDEEAFKEEVVDALHFFIELCIVAGFDAEELHARYLGKHQTNILRQETGY